MLKNIINQFASPKTYLKRCDKYFIFVFSAGLIFLAVGWIWGIFYSPTDVQQGDVYRIIYLHVPTSIYAQLIYWIMAFWAMIHLVWRVRLAAYLIKAAAYIGLLSTFLALFSGSIWGIPTWGTWWQWDARITSTLILFIMYLGLISLHASFENKDKADKFFSVLVLIGVVNIPIIKKSVDWWSTLHQSASITLTSKPAIDPVMLYPLMISIVSFIGLIFGLVILSSQNEILKREKYKSWVKNI